MLQKIMLFLSLALSIPSGEAFIKQSEFKKEILSEMIKNEPFTKSEVNSKDDIQSLNLVGASFHQKTCAQTFSVLGNYENYKNIIGFIKTSTYNESSKKLFFKLSHLLLPFDMFLSFKIPRIRGAGMYRFVFDSGFLKGLIGEVVVEETKKANYSCFISIDIKWSGPQSPFPDFVFRYFSKFLLKRSIFRLWEKSGHHF